MIYRRLSIDGDYSFGRGKQDFIAGTNAVVQAIKTRLLLFVAEWWEDQSEGTPFFQNILGMSGNPENLEAVDLIMQERIINTENVTELIDFSSTYDNRNYSMSCTVNTVFGTTASITLNL